MKLPVLISVPHAGLTVPPEVAHINRLTPEEIAADGDVGAAEIYRIESEVALYETTRVARAFVDLNRAEDDRRADGIVKTHTCWNVPVYSEPLSESTIETLLARYYRPYHDRLAGSHPGIVMGLDCHTMAAHGPPIGPDPGVERPRVCLSNGDGTTCPDEMMQALVDAFGHAFDCEIAVNHPFKGGYITRRHGQSMPWVQVELSRAPFASDSEKRNRLLNALRRCKAW